MTKETVLTNTEIIKLGQRVGAIDPGENGYILPVTQKGDKVMCYLNGEGRILSVANLGISHPITVEFREGRSEYTLCGRRFQADQNPTLFYTGVVFTAERGNKGDTVIEWFN